MYIPHVTFTITSIMISQPINMVVLYITLVDAACASFFYHRRVQISIQLNSAQAKPKVPLAVSSNLSESEIAAGHGVGHRGKVSALSREEVAVALLGEVAP